MYYRKKNLVTLKRARAGSIKNNYSIYLDRNEKPNQFSSSINSQLFKVLKKVQLNFYPEIDTFYAKLSKFIEFPKEGIYLTEGVSGGIKSIIETLTLSNKSNIIFPYPTFAMYDVYAKMFNIEAKHVGYKNYKLDINELEKKINKDTAIVFIPNPNVPIEGMLSLSELKHLADLCKKNKSMLAIDEVYFPFSSFSAKSLIHYYNDTLILQSFSKAFGLAGIRLGYILGTKKNIEYISKMRTGYETNSLSLAIAEYFIKNYKLIKKYVESVREGLDYLKIELDKIKIEHNGGINGNYLFINLKSKKISQEITLRLKKENIYVRGNWPKPFNKGILVSGGPKKIMKIFFICFLKHYKTITKHK